MEYRRVFPDARIIVVDGGSTDGTVDIARSLGVEVIQQYGKGKGNAIKTALQYIKSCMQQPEYVVITDGDYTYPAKPAIRMIEILKENHKVGMVTGDRFHSHTLKSYFVDIYSLGNLILKALHFCLNRVKMKDPLTGLRVIRWKLLKNWQPKSKHFEIEVEINDYIRRRAKIVEVPIKYRKRLGSKKLQIKHGISIAKQIIKNLVARSNHYYKT